MTPSSIGLTLNIPAYCAAASCFHCQVDFPHSYASHCLIATSSHRKPSVDKVPSGFLVNYHSKSISWSELRTLAVFKKRQFALENCSSAALCNQLQHVKCVWNSATAAANPSNIVKCTFMQQSRVISRYSVNISTEAGAGCSSVLQLKLVGRQQLDLSNCFMQRLQTESCGNEQQYQISWSLLL